MSEVRLQGFVDQAKGYIVDATRLNDDMVFEYPIFLSVASINLTVHYLAACDAGLILRRGCADAPSPQCFAIA